MSGCGNNRRPQDAAEIKRQAAGQWIHILKTVCGLTDAQLNPKLHQPCPKCGGYDRFRAFDDVNETGGLICNQCHNVKNSDGFASIQWLNDCNFRTAHQLVSDAIIGPAVAINPKDSHKPCNRLKTVHATAEKAIDALSWSMKENGQIPTQTPPNSTWKYHHADGSEAGAVCRWNLSQGSKEIRQISKVANGWTCSAMPEPRPLWNLPSVIQAGDVWICEGEKAAEVAVQLGVIATTSSGGSNAPGKSDWTSLDGKHVFILPDNDESGEKFTRAVLQLVRKQAPKAVVEVKQLRDDWPEIPEKGDLYDWSEHYDSGDAETLRNRLLALPNRTAAYFEMIDEGDDSCSIETSKSRTFAGQWAADLWDLADQPVEWLVEGIFSTGQPTIFGAKQKSLKTTLLTDLAVSIASGYPWLGRFAIPKRRRVLFVTGEASEAAAIRKVKRAATSRNLTREDFTDCLRIEALTFPALPSLEDCIAVQTAVKEHRIEVVLIDPLYMGMQGVNTSNLNEVGPAMRQFMAHCRPANVIIAHHVKKTASFTDAPNLEDLSQAGIAEFAGNYWLMGRLGEYTGEGLHSLAIRYGGRDEQFGLLKLDFDERKWTSDFSSLTDDKEHRKARKETEQVNAMTQKILDELKRYAPGISESALAASVGSQRHRQPFQMALRELEERKAIVCIPEFKPRNSKETKGWKLTCNT